MFRELEHREPDLRMFVEQNLHLVNLDPDQVLIEEAHIEAMRLVRQSVSVLRLGDQVDVVAFALIFTCLAVDGVICLLVKMFLHFIVGLDPDPSRHLVVRVHPGRWEELDHLMYHRQPYTVIQVELELVA